MCSGKETARSIKAAKKNKKYNYRGKKTYWTQPQGLFKATINVSSNISLKDGM